MDVVTPLAVLEPTYFSVLATTPTTKMAQIPLTPFAITHLVYLLVNVPFFSLTQPHALVEARATALNIITVVDNFLTCIWEDLLEVTAGVN